MSIACTRWASPWCSARTRPPTRSSTTCEVGAARTADPLGGSWYVETLTDEVEAAALKLLGQIEAEGLLTSVGSGRLEDLIDEHNHRTEREMLGGERLKVGVNAFRSERSTPPPRFRIDHAAVAAHLEAFRARKAARELEPLRAALRDIRGTTAAGENAIPAMVRAFGVEATSGEEWGAFPARPRPPLRPVRRGRPARPPRLSR